MDFDRRTEEEVKAWEELKLRRSKLAQSCMAIESTYTLDEQFLKNTCPSLLSLRLRNEKFSDMELGLLLQNAIHLEDLAIDWSTATFEGLGNIDGKCTNLKYLSFHICYDISEKGYSLIGEKFPNLIFFEADGSDISLKNIIKLLENCPKLVGLYIEHSDVLRDEELDKVFGFLCETYPRLGIHLH